MVIYHLTNHDVYIETNSFKISPNNPSGYINLEMKQSFERQFDILKTGFLNKYIQITSEFVEYNGELYPFANLDIIYSNGLSMILKTSNGDTIFDENELFESIETL